MPIIICFSFIVVGSQQPSVHAQDLAEYRDTRSVLKRSGFAQTRNAGDEVVPNTTRFKRTIYGYLPYWADDAENIPWEQLTHLSFFSAEMDTDGSIVTTHGWSSGGAALVQTGASHGVEVTLTATLFGSTEIGELLGSAAHRSAAILNLVDAVSSQNGRGINIDFEFVPKSQKQNFVDFMEDLSDAMYAAVPGSHVTLATPAIDWGGAYDYDALAEAADGMLIMGYGYHWPGDDPGPVAPIDSAEIWPSRSLRWTINDYFQYGLPENRDKFILGLPLYGHDWPSTSLDIPGTRAAQASSRSVRACETYFDVEKLWDEDSQTPFRLYLDNTNSPRQLFCEDEESLRAKLELVEEYDIGGVMWWAIGYTQKDHPVWEDIEELFLDTEVLGENLPPVVLLTAPTEVEAGAVVVLNGSETYDPEGAPLTVVWSQQSGDGVDITSPSESLATVQLATLGTYVFRMTASDGEHSVFSEIAVVVESEETQESIGGGGNGEMASDDTELEVNAAEALLSSTGCYSTRGSWLLGLLCLLFFRRRRSEWSQ